MSKIKLLANKLFKERNKDYSIEDLNTYLLSKNKETIEEYQRIVKEQ